MRKNTLLIVVSIAIAAACSRSGDDSALAKGSPPYELAKELAAQIPSLDPDKNVVLVLTNEFTVLVKEAFWEVRLNMGENFEVLKTYDVGQIKYLVGYYGQKLAEKKMLLSEAEKAQLSVSDSEIEEALDRQYKEAGGRDEFLRLIKKNGLDMDYVRSDLRKELLVQHYVDQIIYGTITVSEQEIQRIYQTDKTASVLHILLRTENKSENEMRAVYRKMEDILARARNGEDFVELAKEYSEDVGSRDTGGLYEDLERGMMEFAFEEAAFATPVGQISEIIETAFGYHILKVIDRKKETRSLEEMRPQLEARIKQRKQNSAYQSQLDGLKKAYGYRIRQL